MRWAALAVIAVTAGACGSSGVSAAAQQAFITQLGDQAPSLVAARGATALVRLGGAACAELASGAGFTAVADSLQARNPDLDPSSLGSLITAAADTLCPQERSQVP